MMKWRRWWLWWWWKREYHKTNFLIWTVKRIIGKKRLWFIKKYKFKMHTFL